ncbi:hypothetical protein PR048_003365 [Dryococelus australis]|uniref:Uncharacterized protein n=1 Tax=Dryococelus australis TaxID=614101 RepID=A0ABQ9IMT3_9NEOP|nr:hypothetical protein PR048_003365 [Dryococelus australis]
MAAFRPMASSFWLKTADALAPTCNENPFPPDPLQDYFYSGWEQNDSFEGHGNGVKVSRSSTSNMVDKVNTGRPGEGRSCRELSRSICHLTPVLLHDDVSWAWSSVQLLRTTSTRLATRWTVESALNPVQNSSGSLRFEGIENFQSTSRRKLIKPKTATHQSQAMRSIHVSKVQAMRSIHVSKVQAMRSIHVSKVQAMRSIHVSKVQAMRSIHVSKVQAMRSIHVSKVQAMRSIHVSKVQAMRSIHVSKVQAMRSIHVSKVQAMRSIHVSKVQAMRSIHVSKVQAMRYIHVSKVREQNSRPPFRPAGPPQRRKVVGEWEGGMSPGLKGEPSRRINTALSALPPSSHPDFRIASFSKISPGEFRGDSLIKIMADSFPVPPLSYSLLIQVDSQLDRKLREVVLHENSARTSAGILFGTTLAGRLGCTPPTMVNRVQSPAGSLPDLSMRESWRTMPLVAGFSRGSSVSPALSFRRCSTLTSIIIIDFRDFAVESRPNLFTRSRIFSLKKGRDAGSDKSDTAMHIKCAIAAKRGRTSYGWRPTSGLTRNFPERRVGEPDCPVVPQPAYITATLKASPEISRIHLRKSSTAFTCTCVFVLPLEHSLLDTPRATFSQLRTRKAITFDTDLLLSLPVTSQSWSNLATARAVRTVLQSKSGALQSNYYESEIVTGKLQMWCDRALRESHYHHHWRLRNSVER